MIEWSHVFDYKVKNWAESLKLRHFQWLINFVHSHDLETFIWLDVCLSE